MEKWYSFYTFLIVARPKKAILILLNVHAMEKPRLHTNTKFRSKPSSAQLHPAPLQFLAWILILSQRTCPSQRIFLSNSSEPELERWAKLPFFNVDLSLDVKDSETEQEVEELKGKMLRKNLGKVETSAFDELMQLKQNMPKALGSVPVELV